MEEENQYFQFREQSSCIIYVDGNYVLNISRALNIKLDMEDLFDDLSKGMFRFKTHWFAALESSLDRNNNTYRFLDRLRYIPRTSVYSGKKTKRSQGHFETALRTDAGVAMATKLIENSYRAQNSYHIVIAGDPEYIPAIKLAQRNGALIRLVFPEYLSDLDPHPDLLKSVDERQSLSTSYLREFEYINNYEEDEDFDEYDEEVLDMKDLNEIDSDSIELDNEGY